MTSGYALQMALGALAGLGLGVTGMVLLPPLLAPGEQIWGPQLVPVTASVGPLAGPVSPPLAPAAEATVPLSGSPRFDTVRVEPDGRGIVAGRAAPGVEVAVLVDGAVVGEARADLDGRFVAFLQVASSPEPRVLSLRERDGSPSEETVLLAPTAPPAPAAALASADSLPGVQPEVFPVSGVEGVVQLAARPELSDLAQAPRGGGSEPLPNSPAGSTALALSVTNDLSPVASVTPQIAAAPPGLPSPATPEPPGQAAILLSDDSGVRVLQPALPAGADPEVLATVALDAISYDGAGEVLVQGRGTPGDGVRLYLDNAPAAAVAIGPDGTWATPLTEAEPGTYTLRLDQLDATGEVVSRIETPFRRERRDDLAAAASQAGFRIVQPGNTLWAIARDRYGEPMMYVRVFEANRDRIRNPDLIYPGQVFLLPEIETP